MAAISSRKTYTYLSNKLDQGKVLSNNEVYELNSLAEQFIIVLEGHGDLTKLLLKHAYKMKDLTWELINARGL